MQPRSSHLFPNRAEIERLSVAEGIAQLGLTEMLKPKVVLTGGGTGPVTFFLARGDFELGIQQTNIMVGDGDNVASHRITIFTSMSSLSGVTDSVP